MPSSLGASVTVFVIVASVTALVEDGFPPAKSASMYSNSGFVDDEDDAAPLFGLSEITDDEDVAACCPCLGVAARTGCRMILLTLSANLCSACL